MLLSPRWIRQLRNRFTHQSACRPNRRPAHRTRLTVELMEDRDLPTVTVVSGVILDWPNAAHSYNFDATAGGPISLAIDHTPVSLLPSNAGGSTYAYANARTPAGFWWDESLDQGALNDPGLTSFAEAISDQAPWAFADASVASGPDYITFGASATAIGTSDYPFFASSKWNLSAHVQLQLSGYGVVEGQITITGASTAPAGSDAARGPQVNIDGGYFNHHLLGTEVRPFRHAFWPGGGGSASLQVLAGTSGVGEGSVSVGGRIDWHVVPFEPLIGLYDPDGNLVATGRNAINYQATKTGRWRVAVTEGNDFNFDGANDTVQSEGIGSYELTISTDVVFHPPVLGALGNQTATEGSTLSFAASATDPDPGQTLTYSLAAAPVGATINPATGAFSFTAVDGPGTFPVTVRVTDNGVPSLSDEESFTITVDNVAPVANIAGPDDGLKGKSFSFTLGANDVSPVDQAAGFTYKIDWDGNGTVDEIVAGPNGKVVQHVFDTAGQTTVIITATDMDGGVSTPVSHVVNVIQPISISFGLQQVSLNGNGLLPIALLSTTDFDVSTLEVSSLRLAGASALHQAFQDVDGDGDLDLVLHFRRQDFVDEYAAALAADLEDGTLDSPHQIVKLSLTGKTISGADVLAGVAIDFFMSGKALQTLLQSL